MLAGELDVSVAGQRFRIEGEGNTRTVFVQTFREAYALRATPLPSELLARGLRFGNLELRAHVGSRQPFQLFPNAGIFVKMLSPSIRELNRKSGDPNSAIRAFS